MKKITYLLFAFLVCSMQVAAQTTKRQKARMKEYLAYADAIQARFQSGLDSIRIKHDSVSETTTISVLPYLYKVTGPAVYYSSAIGSRFALDWKFPTDRQGISLSEGMEYRDKLNFALDDALVNFYMAYPEEVEYVDELIQQEKIVNDAVIVKAEKKDLSSIFSKAEGIKDVTEVVDNIDVDIQFQKPNFWKVAGRFGLQFSQNFVTKNWYKGGNNNSTLLSSFDFSANYNDLHLIQWDNTVEMRLGFITTTDDSIHSYLTNNDRLYVASKLGVKAFKDFYYTMNANALTQFIPGYKSNDTTAYSKFLAPLDVSVSIGLDYKPSLKIGSLSVALLPFSYKMRYIAGNNETIIKAYNMRDGKSTQHDFGSRAEVNINFQLFKNFYWKSRLLYFTTYKYVEAEWENRFQYSFAKYFSAEIYSLCRFDDNRDRKYWDEQLGYFQFKEYLTLGVTYAF